MVQAEKQQKELAIRERAQAEAKARMVTEQAEQSQHEWEARLQAERSMRELRDMERQH